MPKHEISHPSEHSATRARIARLIYGRLLLIGALVLGSLWWAGSVGELFPFFLFCVGLSLVYGLLLRVNDNYAWQERSQLVLDSVLISWLALHTGDIYSPYVSLYIILIAVAGWIMTKVDTFVIAGFSVVCLSAVSAVSGQTLLYSIAGTIQPSRALQVSAFNAAAFLVVGLLAAKLTERRQMRRDLEETVADLADLHILHERIVESVDSGLLTTDLSGRIFSLNRAAEEILGSASSQLIELNIIEVAGEGSRPDIESCLAALRAGYTRNRQFEAKLVVGSNEKTIAFSASPLIARRGTVSGMILTLRDITAIRRLEESLRRADRLAAVGRLAAGLAHEIRNPIGSMSSALQFLQERPSTNSADASLMRVVLSESERLNRIITDFLEYARPQATGLAREKGEPADIGRAIDDCLTLLRHSPSVTGLHRFDYQPPPKALRAVISEPELKQVCWNLLRNSIKAMPDGGLVSVGLEELSDRRVRIVFADTGCGMSRDNLEHLFEPFAHEATGTGLGLSIVHKIITDNGGRIDIDTKAGAGTRIVVDLPAVAEICEVAA